MNTETVFRTQLRYSILHLINEKTGRILTDAACLISGKGTPALISDDQIYQIYLSELFI